MCMRRQVIAPGHFVPPFVSMHFGQLDTGSSSKICSVPDVTRQLLDASPNA